MRKLSIILVLLFSVLFIQQPTANAQELNGIAAVVNKDIITLSQLNDQIGVIKNRLQQQKIKLPPDNVLNNQVLQMLIDQSLEQQTAKRLKITATSEEIKRMIGGIAKQQNISAEQLRESLKSQGVDEDTFIDQVKQQIINQKLLQATVGAQLAVTPEEVNAAMRTVRDQADTHNEYHLLHILVPLPDSPTPTQLSKAKDTANSIIIKLHHGEDFKTLAAAQSTGQQMFNGGDMGWKSLTELPSAFSDPVSNMKQGQIAGPIHTTNGFHILKLVAVRGKKMDLDDKQLKNRVTQMIYQRKLQQKQQEWLQQLRTNAYIKILYQPATLPAPSLG